MPLLLPVLLLLPASPAYYPPEVSSCTTDIPAPLVVLGPRSAETDVPLNTSLWLSLRGDPTKLVVALYDDAQLAIPLQVEVLYTRGGFAAVRARPERDLRPRSRYTLEWRLGEANGGHLFDTGAMRDDQAPDVPRVQSAAGYDASFCGAGVELGVLIFPPDLGVMHEGSVNGAVAGLNRDLELVLHVGEPGLDVVGAVVAMDLAGNRSSSAGYQTTTPSIDEVVGCSTTRGGDTSVMLVWLAVALVVRAMARRIVSG